MSDDDNETPRKRAADDYGDTERRDEAQRSAGTRASRISRAVFPDSELAAAAATLPPDITASQTCNVCWHLLKISDVRGGSKTWEILREPDIRGYSNKAAQAASHKRVIRLMQDEAASALERGVASSFRFLDSIPLSTTHVTLPELGNHPCMCVCQVHTRGDPAHDYHVSTSGIREENGAVVIDSSSVIASDDEDGETSEEEATTDDDEEEGGPRSVSSIHPWQSPLPPSTPGSDASIAPAAAAPATPTHVLEMTEPRPWSFYDARSQCKLFCGTLLCNDTVAYAALARNVPEDQIHNDALFDETIGDMGYTTRDLMHSYLSKKLFRLDPTCVGTFVGTFTRAQGVAALGDLSEQLSNWVFNQWDTVAKRWSPTTAGEPERVIMEYTEIAGARNLFMGRVPQTVTPAPQCINALIRHYAEMGSPFPAYDEFEFDNDLDFPGAQV